MYISRLKRFFKILIAEIFILLICFTTFKKPVNASVYVVTNTANAGLGSLRSAIEFARSDAGSDIIYFATAINGIPIILSGLYDCSCNPKTLKTALLLTLSRIRYRRQPSLGGKGLRFP